MNCERALDAYVGELAGEPVNAVATRHRATCNNCQEAAATLRSSWQDLGLLGDVPVPATLRARVAALVQVSRSEALQRPATAPWSTRVRDWFAGAMPLSPAWRTGPVLAALLLGIAAGMFWERGANRGSIAELGKELQSMRAMVAMSLLEQSSPAERLRGVSWGGRVGPANPELINTLLELLDKDPSVDVRLAIVDALGDVRHLPRVQDGVLESVEKQSSPLVQIALIDALVAWREPRASQVLQRLAADPRADDEVRSRARWALRRLELPQLGS
jgi:hypothetical protein